jgi:hypothetical protein
MIALKIKGQRGWKLSLVFSSGLLNILKSPASNIGKVSESHILTNSARNSCLNLSCAAPYIVTSNHSNPSSFDLIASLTQKSPLSTLFTFKVLVFIPIKIPAERPYGGRQYQAKALPANKSLRKGIENFDWPVSNKGKNPGHTP